MSTTISIIIPAYNEEERIGSLIRYILDNARPSLIEEIKVVDGGSTDRTCEKAMRAGAVVQEADKQGRAVQMNEGAKAATGEILYFLHADTYPPKDFDSRIRAACQHGCQAGCFQLGFDDNHPMLSFYCWFTRFNINAFRFGDQSLFVRRGLFEAIDGFRDDLMVMEDNEIVARIRKKGRFCVLDDRVTTSARRYLRNGVFRLQFVFILIYTLFHLGVRQEILVAIYRKLVK